jgi:hypothetical protein
MMPERARESLARKPESSGVADELSAAPPTDERVSSGGSSLVPRASHYELTVTQISKSNRL